jgi:hypothetical protein
VNLGQARAATSHYAFCGLSREHLGELVTDSRRCGRRNASPDAADGAVATGGARPAQVIVTANLDPLIVTALPARGSRGARTEALPRSQAPSESRVLCPRDMNPHVSEGGLEPPRWWYIPESGIHHHSKVARRRCPARQFAMGAGGSRQSSLPGPEPGLGAPLHRDRVSCGMICHVLRTSLYDDPAAGGCGDAPAGLDEYPEHGL